MPARSLSAEPGAAAPIPGSDRPVGRESQLFGKQARRCAPAVATQAPPSRACPRCAPPQPAKTLVCSRPELVCRTVQLILNGPLDEGSEADLGQRVGVSARHLRR